MCVCGGVGMGVLRSAGWIQYFSSKCGILTDALNVSFDVVCEHILDVSPVDVTCDQK